MGRRNLKNVRSWLSRVEWRDGAANNESAFVVELAELELATKQLCGLTESGGSFFLWERRPSIPAGGPTQRMPSARDV
jgi:hypothetical protein